MTEERSTAPVTKIEEDTTRSLSADELIDGADLSSDTVEAAEDLARADVKHGKAMVALYKTQRAIIECHRKFIGAKCCRRYGKDFIFTLRISKKLHEFARHKYHIFSRSQRQSGDSLAQLAVHLRAQEKALRAKGKRLSGQAPKYDSTRMRYSRADGTAVEYTRYRSVLPNGSQAIALPASPDTCVGSTGSVWFNEFGVLPKLIQRDMYAYLQPMVSSRQEFELCASSTPRGLGTKFHEFFTSEVFAKIFALFEVDIFKAISEGAVYFDYLNQRVVDAEGIARLKEALRDDDRWMTEYLVQFAADVLALLDFEMIGQCESQHDEDGKEYKILDFDMPQDFDPAKTNLAAQLNLKGRDLYIGHDIARQKDLSVIWVDEEVDGRLWNRGIITMSRIDFERQEQALWQFLGHPKMRKAGIDATGMGARTAERAVTKFGSRVVPINFSGNLKDRHGHPTPVKALIARVMRERHQDGRDKYPVLDKIRDDFIRVKRKAGSSPDTFTYFADSDETGHADIFTGKALSCLVAQELLEYGGKVEGMRIVGDQAGLSFENGKPPKFFPEDHHKPTEWAGIGGAL
jgi:hypothetical protein